MKNTMQNQFSEAYKINNSMNYISLCSIILFSLLNTSCQKNETANKKTKDAESSVTHLNTKGTIRLSDIIAEATPLSLEATENSLIMNGGVNLSTNKTSIYIGGMGQYLVQFNKKTGAFIRQIGKTGEGPGEYNQATSLFASEDTLYVVDSMVGKIQSFNSQGVYLSQLQNPLLRNVGKIYVFNNKIYLNLTYGWHDYIFATIDLDLKNLQTYSDHLIAQQQDMSRYKTYKLHGYLNSQFFTIDNELHWSYTLLKDIQQINIKPKIAVVAKTTIPSPYFFEPIPPLPPAIQITLNDSWEKFNEKYSFYAAYFLKNRFLIRKFQYTDKNNTPHNRYHIYDTRTNKQYHVEPDFFIYKNIKKDDFTVKSFPNFIYADADYIYELDFSFTKKDILDNPILRRYKINEDFFN
ncbi:MAG: 6-bladed beta-propeller [Bacteroidetes Order II. Incertae sedis bacterium]|nr:6-bladed beta-propeller [Bacteroidetes Order II. bacterium]